MNATKKMLMTGSAGVLIPPLAAPSPRRRPPRPPRRQARRAQQRRPAAIVAPTARRIAGPKRRNRPAASSPASRFADIGFASGFRFSNLGGRQEIFLPLPPGADLTASELLLSLDDVSAHEARRSLEILVNDRSAAAIALDGKTMGRQVRVPLAARQGPRRVLQAHLHLFRRRDPGPLHRRALDRRQPHGAAGKRDRDRDRLADARRRHHRGADAARRRHRAVEPHARQRRPRRRLDHRPRA